ncbi:hypothetical protein WAI453_013495 [Rhynchosporium graminicola]
MEGLLICLGTEDAEEEPQGLGTLGVSLVHYDIKLDNIFMGDRDPDHMRYPVLVLGAWGSARDELKSARRAASEEIRARGAPVWTAPENKKDALSMSRPFKGACCNIFQIGLIMHALLNRFLLYPARYAKLLWPPPYSDVMYVGKYTYGTD